MGPVGNWVLDAVKMSGGFSGSFIDTVTHELGVFREFLRLDVGGDGDAGGTEGDRPDGSIFVVNHAGDVFVPPALYLTRAGYRVETFQPSSAVPSGHFDFGIVWAGRDFSAESVEPFARGVKPQRGEGADQAATVVAVVHDGVPLPQSRNAHVTMMKHGFDLRELYRKIAQSLQGHSPQAS